MRQRYFFACISMLFFLPFSLQAWHIVGGELSYACLGNDQYRIRLTIFRDCGQTVGAPFDNPAAIGFFNSSNQLIDFIQVPLGVQDDTLNPTLQSQCFTNPPNVCVHTTTYEAIVELPFLAGGYQIVYQRCCRNQTITNIVAPNTQGATYSIHLTEEAMLQCNSSPQFNNWPPLYICANYPFSIDQSATDEEGDSLVYRLCQPFQGADQAIPQPIPPNNPPYQQVTWIDPPYNIDNMLNGVAGGEAMKIDPNTGLLTGTPTTIGQFVIGICVEEYRNGQLISVTRRDYQLNVGECGFPTSAFFAPEKLCETYTVGFDNNSQNAQSYLWFFGDPANPNASSSLSNPTYTYGDTGTYTITLIAEPGTVCADTTSHEVQIILNSLFANFNIEQADCADSLTVQITDSTVDTASAVSAWKWILEAPQGTQTSTLQNPTFALTEQGTADLTLLVTSTAGCTDTLTQSFPIHFINDVLILDTTVCNGSGGGIALNPNGSFPGATYSWQPAGSLDNPDSPNPIATPDSTTTYSVTISDQQFCTIEKSVTVVVSPVLSVTPVLDTILEGESVQILATENAGYQYVWSPGNWLSGTSVPNPISTPEETTTYLLTVTDEFGCVVQRSVTIVVLSLCEEPYLFIPTGFTPNGDGKNDAFRVMGNNIDEVYLAVYNRWGEMVFETETPGVGWDGTFGGKEMAPDVFGFYLKVRCFGGLEYVKKGNVTLLR